MKKLIFLTCLVAGIYYYHAEIKNISIHCYDSIHAELKSAINSLSHTGKIVQDVGSSLKTIKGLNEKTLSQEKTLDELMPNKDKGRQKREYLLNYDRKKLDTLLGHR